MNPNLQHGKTGKNLRKCTSLVAEKCTFIIAKKCAFLIAKKCALLFTDYTRPGTYKSIPLCCNSKTFWIDIGFPWMIIKNPGLFQAFSNKSCFYWTGVGFS